jgi:hypothetical protein
MEAKTADHVWSIRELLEATLNSHPLDGSRWPAIL